MMLYGNRRRIYRRRVPRNTAPRGGLAKTKLAVRSNSARNARPSSTLAFSVENAAASCSSASAGGATTSLTSMKPVPAQVRRQLERLVPRRFQCQQFGARFRRPTLPRSQHLRQDSQAIPGRKPRSLAVSCRASASSDSSLFPMTHASVLTFRTSRSRYTPPLQVALAEA